MKDIFNPDSYTEEAMPLTTELCCVLDTGDLGKTSSALRECKEKHKELNNKFFNSLTKEQQEKFRQVLKDHIEKFKKGHHGKRGPRESGPTPPPEREAPPHEAP